MALLYFLLGIFTSQFAIPFLDGILSSILTWLEAKKAKQSEVINMTNIKLQQAMAAAEGPEPKVIKGFAEYQEEDDDNAV